MKNYLINIFSLRCFGMFSLTVTQFNPSKEFLLYEWLREKGLDHYFINFVQSDLVDFNAISRLNLPDDDLYDELEITLPGHKRRLERAGKLECLFLSHLC